jgi:hypothetical protein
VICAAAGALHGEEPKKDGHAPAPAALIRSARGGPWSAPDTWEGGKVPGAGVRVQVRAGHTVTYDLSSDRMIRSIHVAGTLTFARDRDTRLDVGLIKIQAGDGHGTELRGMGNRPGRRPRGRSEGDGLRRR